jgi:transposase-like protein/ribosomal protein L37AE/L43A
MEFLAQYPDDATCLDYLWRTLYSEDGRHYTCPKCDEIRTFHRVASRPLYSCAKCGYGIHPTAGTIFEKSSTSLHLWFYGIFLMSSTRCGISAKQLERELGVTYKTAWRMFNKIRSLLVQDDEQLSGTVEIDEAFIGGQAKWRSAARSRARGVKGGGPSATHTRIVGMVQRGDENNHGKVYVTLARGNKNAPNYMGHVLEKVLPASTVYTDEAPNTEPIGKWGYQHSRVNHSEKVYVSGDVHTNSIEGFWALTKRGIGGVYHSVSAKYLQTYLDEYAFRYNNRDVEGRGMFTAFLDRVIQDAETRPAPDTRPLPPSESPSEVQS